jgi:integrase
MASASVVKRRTSWFVRVTGARGERERWVRAGATKREAEQLRTQILADMAGGRPRPVVASGRSGFAEVSERWWSDYAEVHVTLNTRRSYAYEVKALREWFGSQPIGEIDLGAIDEMIGALVRAGAAPQTTRHRVNRLRQILTWGASRGLCETPPARIKTPKVKRVIEPLPLRPAELEALLSEAPTPWGALFATIAMHGLRPGEARFLRWGDISRGRLHIRGAIDSVGEEHEPKASSTRAVPLDPFAAELLAELPSGAPADRVFPGLELPQATAELRAALLRADVAGAQWRVLYDLRHTYATLNILLAVGPATLARRMGNSVKVCMDTYVAWWEDLAPDAEVTVSGALGRRPVVDGYTSGVPEEWKYPANAERETGLEPATFSLEGRRRRLRKIVLERPNEHD